MKFAPQLTLSLLTQCEWIYFLDLVQLKDLLLLMQFKLNKGAIILDTPLSIYLLTIEVFGYFHTQANVFLHICANAIWSFKGPKDFPLSIFVTFLCQQISITLPRIANFHIKLGDSGKPTTYLLPPW